MTSYIQRSYGCYKLSSLTHVRAVTTGARRFVTHCTLQNSHVTYHAPPSLPSTPKRWRSSNARRVHSHQLKANIAPSRPQRASALTLRLQFPWRNALPYTYSQNVRLHVVVAAKLSKLIGGCNIGSCAQRASTPHRLHQAVRSRCTTILAG
jgi:hypothetical protein